jgi:transcription initiation factor IIE alpha subunit
VIADLGGLGHPCVDMHMLVLCVLLQRFADEHVVELLCVHVEQVRVALELVDARDLVEITETRYLDELF